MRTPQHDLDLRSFGGALRSFWRLVAAATVVGALAGLLLGATKSREFVASAAVEVETSNIESASSSTIEARLQAVELLLQSPEVRSAAARLLGSAADDFVGLTARRDPEAPLITITATATSASSAVAAADFVVKSAIEQERDRLDARTQTTIDRLGVEQTSLQTQITALDTQIAALDEQSSANLVASFAANGTEQTLEQAVKQLDGERQAAEATQLRQQRADLQANQNEVAKEIREFEIRASTTSIGFAEYRTARSATQTGTGPLELAFVLGFAGLVLGAGAAFVVASADGRMRTSPAIEAERLEVPLLGDAVVADEVLLNRPFDPDEDADVWVSPDVRSLAMSIPFVVANGGPFVVGVVAPRRDDGGGLLAFQIADTVARSGRSVLFIDGDLERAIGTKPGGVSAMILDDLPMAAVLDDVLVPRPGGLSVLVAGGAEGEAFTVLGSSRVRALVDEARRQFDVVVIDVPPLLEAPESPGIALAVDSVILVARAGQTRRDDVASGLDRLRAVGAPTAGLVVLRAGGRRVERLRTISREQRPPTPVVSTRATGTEERASVPGESPRPARVSERRNGTPDLVEVVNGAAPRRKSGAKA